MTFTVDSMEPCVGMVIHEHPYVKVLSRPKLVEYELAPGFTRSRWEAIAQVNEMLALIELKVGPR